MRSAEQLLATHGLSQISVDALARGAGLSRSAFYFYFPSKDAVVLGLVERLVHEAATARDAALLDQGEDGPEGLRSSIAIFYETFGAHRPVVEAAVELSATNEEARALWSEIMEGWVEHAAERIEGARAKGLAPPGMPARELAIALVQLNEEALRAVYTKSRPALSEESAIDVLAHIWISAIYMPPREHARQGAGGRAGAEA